MKKIGYDNELYLKTQSAHIQQRIAQFGGKLYLEFGGKLYDDFHASRVLPGFAPDSKLQMLLQLKEQVEVVIAINAADIEKNKVRLCLELGLERTQRGCYPSSSKGHHTHESERASYPHRYRRSKIQGY